jgi:hypothetical protein
VPLGRFSRGRQSPKSRNPEPPGFSPVPGVLFGAGQKFSGDARARGTTSRRIATSLRPLPYLVHSETPCLPGPNPACPDPAHKQASATQQAPLEDKCRSKRAAQPRHEHKAPRLSQDILAAHGPLHMQPQPSLTALLSAPPPHDLNCRQHALSRLRQPSWMTRCTREKQKRPADARRAKQGGSDVCWGCPG